MPPGPWSDWIRPDQQTLLNFERSELGLYRLWRVQARRWLLTLLLNCQFPLRDDSGLIHIRHPGGDRP